MSETRIRFKGPWADSEEATIRDAIEQVEAHLSETQRDALRGAWIATMNNYDGGGKYVVVHRRGMGAALTGGSADEVARRLRARWLGVTHDEK